MPFYHRNRSSLKVVSFKFTQKQRSKKFPNLRVCMQMFFSKINFFASILYKVYNNCESLTIIIVKCISSSSFNRTKKFHQSTAKYVLIISIKKPLIFMRCQRLHQNNTYFKKAFELESVS